MFDTLLNTTAWKKCVFGVILVQMRGNTDQNNSEYGHSLRSVRLCETFGNANNMHWRIGGLHLAGS